MADAGSSFVSRGGLKLEHALATFGVDVAGLVCADLGCSTGGFTDCLLKRGAAKVYAVDTGYGVLDYTLRKDARVVVRERSNAMHVMLPERVDVVTIDASWTRQDKLLPNVRTLLKPGGRVVTLVKPHYEADPKRLRKGVLPAEEVEATFAAVRDRIAACGFDVLAHTTSPILGGHGNTEVLALLRRSGQEICHRFTQMNTDDCGAEKVDRKDAKDAKKDKSDFVFLLGVVGVVGVLAVNPSSFYLCSSVSIRG